MTRLFGISAVVLMFCACGPGAKISGGKQGAAEALFAASGPTKGGSTPGSGVDLTATVNVACPQGGSASLHGFALSTNAGSLGTDIGETFTADYNNCGVQTKAGVAVLQGSLSVSQAIKVLSGDTEIEQSIKGKVLWGGACDDFLDVDISQNVGVTAFTQTSGGVSMTLKGTVADTEGTFTYDEAVSVTPGTVTVAVSETKK